MFVLCIVLDEPVAHAAYIFNAAGSTVCFLQLPAYPVQAGMEAIIGIPQVIVTPHLTVKLFIRKYPFRTGCKQAEQVKLIPRKLHFLRIDKNLVIIHVNK